jgi:hypothetical protein
VTIVIGYLTEKKNIESIQTYIYIVGYQYLFKESHFFLKRNFRSYSSFVYIIMDDNYYLPHGPLHEHNRMVSEMGSTSSDYLSYSLPEFHTGRTPKKNTCKLKQQHHRTKTCFSKSKTQITEKEAKDAIMGGLVTETNDIDITKLSGRVKSSIHICIFIIFLK